MGGRTNCFYTFFPSLMVGVFPFESGQQCRDDLDMKVEFPS
jgi:hypothetical protein